MKNLAGVILGLCDILEAEGRLLQEQTLRTLRKSLFLITGMAFIAAALAFLVASGYSMLITFMARPLALALMGVLCAIIASIFLWLTKSRNDTTVSSDKDAGTENITK